MDFVFFDIECAVVSKSVAKICAFGYVVCDENFRIKKREDILLNPHGAFHLTDRKGENGIVLPYEYSEFKNRPDFPTVYGDIKRLLEDKNHVVFGHAVINDVKYLNLETKRFKLPSFEFSFYDSQLIYMSYVNDFSRQFGLEYIANALGVEFTPHRAVDDAYATMKIVEAMCKQEGCGFFALAEKLGAKSGSISSWTIRNVSSVGSKKYSAEKAALQKKRRAFWEKVSSLKCRRGKLKNTVFTFSRELEDEFSFSEQAVEKIYMLGGRYSGHVTHCKVYVCNEDDVSVRTQNAKKLPEIKIINPGQLKEILDG